jgi:hypothetical protein
MLGFVSLLVRVSDPAFFLIAKPDPGFYGQKFLKNTAEKILNFFGSKTTI